MTITVGGGISINGIHYTIFSKVLNCSALCSNFLPYEESHMQIYSDSTELDCNLVDYPVAQSITIVC